MIRIFNFVFAVFLVAFVTMTVPLEAAAEEAHPLVRALALTDAEAEALTAEELITAADWLTAWGILGPRAPVQGKTEDYLTALKKARGLYGIAQRKDPKSARALWKHAMASYSQGELTPSEDKAARIPLYEEMIALTDKCLTFAPEEAGCWHYKGVGVGRLGTTKGLLSSMMSASDVEEAWTRAIALDPKDAHVWGDPLLPGVYLALAIFYRLVPDLWLVKMAIGTRGDKEKSVAMMRKAVAAQPYRLEMQKELAVSLVCLGHAKDNAKAIAEGQALFRRVVAGDFDIEDIRATDAIDKRHAADMLARPELACKYSRDGYQEVDLEEGRKQLGK